MANELLKLQCPPKAYVTSMEFHRTDPNLLLVASWDKSVRTYRINPSKSGGFPNDEPILYYEHKAPALTCCFGRNLEAFSAGIDGDIARCKPGFPTTIIGAHADTVTALAYNHSHSLLASGSLDKCVSLWDPRDKIPFKKYVLPHAIQTLDVSDERLVAIAGDEIYLHDFRALNKPINIHKKCVVPGQSRGVKMMPDGEGCMITSVSGRCELIVFDRPSMNYSFKAHRQEQGPTPSIYPINAVAYHPIQKTFLTGASDGSVISWGGVKKVRIGQLVTPVQGSKVSPVSALAYSSDGKHLAIAFGDTFDGGDVYASPITTPQTEICLMTVA